MKMCICIKQARLTYLRGVNVLVILVVVLAVVLVVIVITVANVVVVGIAIMIGNMNSK